LITGVYSFSTPIYSSYSSNIEDVILCRVDLVVLRGFVGTLLFLEGFPLAGFFGAGLIYAN
jgi:hypothetical protein